VFALAGNNGNGGNNAAASIYAHTSDLNEVTASNNGSCTPPAAAAVLCTATGAANTYNGPTGWGTPNGITAFQSITTSGSGVTVSNPGNQTSIVNDPTTLQIHASDATAGQTLTFTATGLPAGLTINSAGQITGTPTTIGTSQVSVTATDTAGATGTTSFNWSIVLSSVSSPGATQSTSTSPSSTCSSSAAEDETTSGTSTTTTTSPSATSTTTTTPSPTTTATATSTSTTHVTSFVMAASDCSSSASSKPSESSASTGAAPTPSPVSSNLAVTG
jgi:hypothetical protein